MSRLQLDRIGQTETRDILRGLITTAYFKAHEARLSPRRELTLVAVAEQFLELAKEFDSDS